MAWRADDVVLHALAAYERRRVVTIPGRTNAVVAAIASALPNAIVVPMVRRAMMQKPEA